MALSRITRFPTSVWRDDPIPPLTTELILSVFGRFAASDNPIECTGVPVRTDRYFRNKKHVLQECGRGHMFVGRCETCASSRRIVMRNIFAAITGYELYMTPIGWGNLRIRVFVQSARKPFYTESMLGSCNVLQCGITSKYERCLVAIFAMTRLPVCAHWVCITSKDVVSDKDVAGSECATSVSVPHDQEHEVEHTFTDSVSPADVGVYKI